MIPGSATPLLLAGAAAEPAAFQIDRSLRFNSADSAYLNRTPSSAGNRRTWTWSAWVKLSSTSTGRSRLFGACGANTGSPYNFATDIGLNGNKIVFTNSANDIYTTDAVFRDFSAWYHIVVTLDTTDATTANRVKIYVNGVLQDKTHPGHGGAGEPSQNTEYAINNTDPHNLGSTPNTSGTATSFFDGYLADVHFIDGQALAPTDFGQFDDNNVWQAKAFVATGPNDGTTWSNSCSGTIYNASLGYANAFDGSLDTFSHAANGNTITFTPSSAIPVSSSVRIFCALGSITGSSGTADVTVNGTSYVATANTNRSNGYFDVTGISSITSITWERAADNDLVAVSAIQVDGVTLIDGNTSNIGVNGFHLPFSDNSINAALGYDAAVDAPTLNPKGGMDVVTYTGNGSTQTISGLAFQPDLVWIKDRTQAFYHELQDTVRGAGNRLIPNDTAAESSANQTLTAFTSDGFTVNWISGFGRNTNESPDAYVAWCWKAGGAAVSNTDGSITSQVSASTDYGFSIVKYTGTSASSNTIGHSLGSEAKFIIVKSTSDADNWFCYHIGLDSTSPENYDISLNTSSARRDFVSWNDTKPTGTVFSVGNTGATNENGRDYIAYCWSEVAGFSKLSSYSGNGSNTGTVVTTGFKPRFVLIKGTSSARDWWIYDSQRDSTNPNMARLSPNSSSAEATNVYAIDFLDNGFQLKTSDVALNGSGETYIYAAFADRPGNNWDVNNLVAEAAGLETANQGFDVVTYTGNGSTQTISGLNFSPDLVWLKNRSSVANHWLVDSVRGVGVGGLSSSLTAAESNPERFSSFNEDGFTVASGAGESNNNNDTYVAWCWKAGGTASSNTDGTITSTVSVNTTYGFSIVSYTGSGSNATVGHGLGATPAFVLVKNRSSAVDWVCNHQDLSSRTQHYLLLNSTSAETSTTGYWNTGFNSTTFGVGNAYGGVNASGNDYIAYCWSEVSGFSKFNTYSGGTANQTISTGFKPRYLLIKRTDAANSWLIFDSARGVNKLLRAEASDSEFSASGGLDEIEFLNDGFKLVSTNNGINGSGGTYIYAAFAGKPDGSIIDSLIDTPTNYEASPNNGGNYATLNPLANALNLTNGNISFDIGARANWKVSAGTVHVASGKWYWEATNGTQNSAGGNIAYGLRATDASSSFTNELGYNDGNKAYFASGITRDGTTSSSSYGATFGTNDIIGVAFDADAGTLVFYKNGISQGTAFTGLTGSWSPAVGLYTGGTQIGTDNFDINFGQRPFSYTPPTGFKSLCTTNLPDPTIADGSTYFDTKLYTGNGSSQTISGFSFSPDFAWFKNRATNKDPRITDTIRGTGVELYPSSTSGDYSQPQGVTAFNSDGVSVGSDGGYNGSGQGMVLWAWDGGSSTVSNTDGSITSNVRANASAGFSIVSYTGNNTSGATVGHGLNAEVEFAILKTRDQSGQYWHVYHSALAANEYIYLNVTNSKTSGNDFMNGTRPSSSVFTLGNGNACNKSGDNVIAYCFAPVEGYSAFGSYTGNGSADGPFVYTGFRPRWVLIKWTSGSNAWIIIDTARDPFNVQNKNLNPNDSSAENTSSSGSWFDGLSNGFKITGVTDNVINSSGGTYIYAAFAEHPFKTARAR